MSQSQTCTVLVSYEGLCRQISFPQSTQFEDFIKLAMEVFEIPFEVYEFVEISSSQDYIFKKNTFENYLLLFPKPEITFQIDVNFNQLIESVTLCTTTTDPLEDLNAGLKRRHKMFIKPEEDYEACEPTVKRQKMNCFVGPDMMETL